MFDTINFLLCVSMACSNSYSIFENFHKAISESGGGRNGVLTGRPIHQENADSLYSDSAESIGINFARKHNIEGTDAAALAKLRSLSVEEIVDGGQEIDSAGLHRQN